MPPADIISLTEACRTELTGLLRERRSSADLFEWLEVQQARLNLWAQTLGIFASDALSITHRLAKNEQVTRIIVQLLTALKGNLYLLTCSLDGRTPIQTEPTALYSEDSDETSSSSADSALDSNEGLSTQQKRKIEDGLARLGQVAVRLRREGTKRAAQKAATYEPLGASGEKLAPAFEDYIKTMVRREFDPIQAVRQTRSTTEAATDEPWRGVLAGKQYPLPDYLRDRLRLTMLARWRRIAYQRHHAVGLAGNEDIRPSGADPPKARGRPPTAIVHDKQLKAPAKAAGDLNKQTQKEDIGRSPKSAATETDERLVIDKKKDLLPKTAGTMTTKVRAGDLSFPAPPEAKDGTDLFICPFCGIPQSVSILPRKKWQLHVMQDLAPYFCVFEHCDAELKTYTTSDDWAQHCLQHSVRTWSCNACPHEKHVQFGDPDEYERHLQAKHANNDMSTERISLLIEMGAQHSPVKFPHCLLCGFIPEAYQNEPNSDGFQKEVVTHMQKRHMQAFALDSMPWDIPGADGDDDYHMSHKSHTESADEREKILDDADLDLHFDLNDDEKREIDNDSSLRQYLVPTAVTGGAMFLEIRKRYTVTGNDSSTRLHNRIVEWLSTQEGNSTEELGHSQQVVWPSNQESRGRDPELNNDGSPEGAANNELRESARAQQEQELLALCRQKDIAGVAAFFEAQESVWNSLFTAADDEGVQCMQYAALSDSPELIKLLIDRGYPIGIDAAFRSLSPLSIAASRGNVATAQALLDAKIPTQGQTTLSHTHPLHAAAAAGKLAMVKFLIDNYQSVPDIVNNTAYYDLCKDKAVSQYDLRQNWERFKSDPADSFADKSLVRYEVRAVEGPALLVAALRGYEDVVKLLLAHGADPNSQHIKTWWYVEAQTDIDKIQEEGVRETLCTLLAYAGKSDILRMILTAGADPFDTDWSGKNAAANAASGGQTDTLMLLSEHTRQGEKWTESMNYALSTAAEYGRNGCIEYILEQGIDIDVHGLNQYSALHAAVIANQISSFEYLVNRGADIEATDRTGDSALNSASYWGYHALAKRLIDLGAKVDVPSSSGMTALSWACWNRAEGSTECVRLLLAAGANVSVSDTSSYQPLHYAAERSSADIVELLLAAGAEVDARLGSGKTPLMLTDSVDVATLLINAGADVNCRTTDTTVLGNATSQTGKLELVTLLIDKGAEIELTGENNVTPLHLACRDGRMEILKYLIKCGAKLNTEDDEGNNPLMTTVERNQIECLEILLEAGNVDTDEQSQWKPALLRAAQDGSLGCLRLLLAKTGPSTRDEYDQTPLMLAASRGHKECVELLLDAGADVNAIDGYNKTALSRAAAVNWESTIKLLLEHKCDVDAMDWHGHTPLRLAVSNPDRDTAAAVRHLLDAGADVNMMSGEDQPILAKAIEALQADSPVEHVQMLIQHPTMAIDAESTPDQISALLVAINSDRLEIMEWLLAAGAAATRIHSSTGTNCLGYALSNVHKSAAALLMRKGIMLSPGHVAEIVSAIIWTCSRMLEEDEYADIVEALRKARSAAQRVVCEQRADGAWDYILSIRTKARLREAARRAQVKLSNKPNVKFALDNEATSGGALAEDSDSSGGEIEVSDEQADADPHEDEEDEPIGTSRLAAAAAAGLATESRPKTAVN